MKLKIREIADSDADSVIDLLTRGFSADRKYWEVGFSRLRTRMVPPDSPRYGFILEADERLVGVILAISSLQCVKDRYELFTNLSSWYVEPAFRSHAIQLFKRALANKRATYLNVSAATHIRPIIEAFGFKRYSEGQVLGLLALKRNRRPGEIKVYGPEKFNELDLDIYERQILDAQAAYGCITFCCVTNGAVLPFVFIPRLIKKYIPCAHLAYCRNISDLRDVAGTVGRHLLRLGLPFVLVDANETIAGIPGVYFAGVTPKYYKGAMPPALGNLCETEATIIRFS